MFDVCWFFKMMAAKGGGKGATVQSIDLLQILFDKISELTFGLIDDLASLVMGVLCLVFLYIGVDILLTALGHRFGERRRNKLIGVAESLRAQRDEYEEDSVAYEFHDLKYKQYLKKAADIPDGI